MRLKYRILRAENSFYRTNRKDLRCTNYQIPKHAIEQYYERILNVPKKFQQLTKREVFEVKKKIKNLMKNGISKKRINYNASNSYYIKNNENYFSLVGDGNEALLKTILTDSMTINGLEPYEEDPKLDKSFYFEENTYYEYITDIEDELSREKVKEDALKIHGRASYILKDIHDLFKKLNIVFLKKPRKIQENSSYYKILSSKLILLSFIEFQVSRDLWRTCRAVLGPLWFEINDISSNVDFTLLDKNTDEIERKLTCLINLLELIEKRIIEFIVE